MRITKLEHACLILEKSNRRIIVDPGSFTTPITDAAGVDAIIVTHEHADHWTPEQLNRILAVSPGADIFTTPAAATQMHEANLTDVGTIHAVSPGEELEIGPFNVQFYGGDHAEIHSSIPRVDNVGIIADGQFGYAGDSYALPPRDMQLEALAVPANAPWMRLADSMNYVMQMRAKTVFGVHEMLLSQRGKDMAAARIGSAAAHYGGTYADLKPYETLTIPE